MNQMRGALLSCAGLLGAAAAPEALGQCLYDVEFVVTPDFGCPEYLVQYSVLNALNEAGQGAGTTIVCTFSSRAFSWSSQTGYRLLTGFPPGSSSAVDGMNEGGLIAGTMSVAASDLSAEAFIHDGHQVISLGAPPGASYSYAEAINEQGWVVGRWRSSTLQEAGAMVMTPQEPLPADLDRDCQVAVLDLLAMLASWGTCEPGLECPADVNADGVVNRQDLTILLMSWS